MRGRLLLPLLSFDPNTHAPPRKKGDGDAFGPNLVQARLFGAGNNGSRSARNRTNVMKNMREVQPPNRLQRFVSPRELPFFLFLLVA
jgi:hypothetical protein